MCNLKPFINKYDWKELMIFTQQKNWKKLELNNSSITLDILYVPYNTEQIRLACKSKYNFKCENKIVLSMITDRKKWHYLAVKSLSALLWGITSKHVGNFYCLNCFHLYITKNKLKKHEKVCNGHDYCYIEMPNGNDKILKYNHGEKSVKVPFIIYADIDNQ